MKKTIMLSCVFFCCVIFCLTVKAEAEVPEFQVIEIEQEVLFQEVEHKIGVPKEFELSYEDPITNTKKMGYYPIKSKEILQERWTDNFSAKVIFYTYDAEYYELGEYKIPSHSENPGLEGYEGELLKQLELSAEDYQIEHVAWTGEPYVNEDGILCRDAVATGRKKVRDYLVVYGGTAEVLAEPLREKEHDDIQIKETRISIMEEKDILVGSEGGVAASQAREQFIRRFVVISLTIALFLLILILLYLLVQKKRKKEKNQEIGQD